MSGIPLGRDRQSQPGRQNDGKNDRRQARRDADRIRGQGEGDEEGLCARPCASVYPWPVPRTVPSLNRSIYRHARAHTCSARRRSSSEGAPVRKRTNKAPFNRRPSARQRPPKSKGQRNYTQVVHFRHPNVRESPDLTKEGP